jgi:hypothetical protein
MSELEGNKRNIFRQAVPGPVPIAEPALYHRDAQGRPQLLLDHLCAAADLGREYQAAC